MADSDTKLSSPQERAIIALLSERTLDAAAIAAKIGRRTLWRWLHTPLFSAAYRQAKADAVGQAISRLQNASSKAVDALVEIIDDVDAPAAVRVTAASKILEMAIRGTELSELQRRVEALERPHAEWPDQPETDPIVTTH